MKKRKIISTLFMMLVCLVIIIIYMNKVSNMTGESEVVKYSKTIRFDQIDQDITISTKALGIVGGMYQIVFSNSETNEIDNEQAITFKETEIYYKQQAADSLYIYYPTKSAPEIENKKLGKINFVLRSFPESRSNEYREFYKDSGLTRISAVEGFK